MKLFWGGGEPGPDVGFFFPLLELGTKCLYLAKSWFCLTFTSVEVLIHSTNWGKVLYSHQAP